MRTKVRLGCRGQRSAGLRQSQCSSPAAGLEAPLPAADRSASWWLTALGRVPDPGEGHKALWLKLQTSVTGLGQFCQPQGLACSLLGSGQLLRTAPFSTLPLSLLTAHLRQLEEHGLKARISPPSVGYQRDEQNVLGGEEGQVVGGGIGATQPVGTKGAGMSKSSQNPSTGDPRTSPLTLVSFTKDQEWGHKAPPHEAD